MSLRAVQAATKSMQQQYTNHEAHKLLRKLCSTKHSPHRELVVEAFRIYGATAEPRSEYVLRSLLGLCRDETSKNLLMSCTLTKSRLWKDIEHLPPKSQSPLVIKFIKLLDDTRDLDHIQQLIAKGIISDTISIKTALITRYGMNTNRCTKLNGLNGLNSLNPLQKAMQLFNTTDPKRRDKVMYGAIMTVLIHHEKYQEAVDVYNSEMTPSLRDHVCNALAIKAFSVINNNHSNHQIHRIEEECHSQWIQSQNQKEDISPVQSALIHHYGNRGNLHRALSIWNWNGNESKNRVLVNAMMTCCIANDDNNQALRLFDEFIHLKPDSIATSLALKACSNLSDYQKGKEIIARNIKTGNNRNPYHSLHIQLKHSLIRFYGESGDLKNAQTVFESICDSEKDVFSINCMMTAYIHNEHHSEALRLYEMNEMNRDRLDSISHSLALKACSGVGLFAKGKRLHSFLKKEDRIKGDIHVQTALIDLYGRSHDVTNALHIFNSIVKEQDESKKSIDSIDITPCYNAMMNVYLINERYTECMQLFDVLQVPNSVSFTTAFTSCANGQFIEIGNRIYNQLMDGNHDGDDYNHLFRELSLLSSLINMFGHFGDLKMCHQIFDERVRTMDHVYRHHIGIWNVMIQALGINGNVVGAKRIFQEMQSKTEIKVDSKAYVTLFNACSHGGDVETARDLWTEIESVEIKYHSLVVSSFVDCLSRNGYLYEAFDIIILYESLTEKYCEEMWLSLLSGCKTYENGLFARTVDVELRRRFGNLSGIHSLSSGS